MEKRNMPIKSNDNLLTLNLIVTIPEEPKGIFLVSHGMAEHKERYYSFLEEINKYNYITAIYDHRGHGESILNKNDLGYFYDNKGKQIVEDLHLITQKLQQEFPNLPVILFAHSMGTLVARNSLKKYDKEYSKVILCGPPYHNKFAPLGLLLTNMISWFHSDHYRSQFIQNMIFSSYNKNFNEESKNRWICQNQDVVKQYDLDPLCGFIFTLNGFKNLFYLMKNCFKKEEYFCNHPELPIFLISGLDDPTVGNSKNWNHTIATLQKIGYKKVSSKRYFNNRHELLNEINHKEIEKDILTFIEKK